MMVKQTEHVFINNYTEHVFINIHTATTSDFEGPSSVLILHPIYAGSHVLTLQSIATRLLATGHQVSFTVFLRSRSRIALSVALVLNASVLVYKTKVFDLQCKLIRDEDF
jgi:hypothetical protein